MFDAFSAPDLTVLERHVDARAHTRDLASFARYHGYEPALHHQLLCDALDRIATEGGQKIMLFLPPGSAKSTYSSVLFPAYFEGKFPGRQLITACHTDDLAKHFGRRVRQIAREPGYQDLFGCTLTPGMEAATEWSLTNGSEYKATGVGGPLSGRRADVLLIDDPVKDMESALSPVMREKTYDWYKSVALTRLRPGGSQVLIMTRWHEADLAGRILDDFADWQVITIRMESEGDDPLGRPVGERLWPEYFSAQMVRDAKVDPRIWTSLYQQRPAPLEGAFFKVGLVQRVAAQDAPRANVYAAHDWAYSEGTGDYTAFGAVRRGDDGLVYVDVRRFQQEPHRRNKSLIALARAMSPVRYRIPEEMGGAGKEAAEHFRRELAAAGVYSGRTQRISGDKAVRASAFAQAVNAGLVRLIESPTAHDFIEEMRTFPNGKHDDMIDAVADAYNEMVLNSVGNLISEKLVNI